jgi:hypothetical protein
MFPAMGIRDSFGIVVQVSSALEIIPFATYGFAWAIPAITGGFFGTLFYGFDKNKK